MQSLSIEHSAATPKNGTSQAKAETPIEVIHPGVVRGPEELPVTAASPWSGSVKPAPFQRRPAKFPPAVAVHDDKLCVLWQYDSDYLCFAYMSTEEAWSGPFYFWAVDAPGGDGIKKRSIAPPALAEVGDVLHAVIVEDGNKIAHYICDDSQGLDSASWNRQLMANGDFHTTVAPAITSFNDSLYLTFQDPTIRQLFWAKWTSSKDGWSDADPIFESSWGCPGILVLDNELHIVFSDSKDRGLIEIVFDGKSWKRALHPPGEATAGGLTVSSYTKKGLLTFPANVKDNKNAPVLVCIWEHGSWSTSAGEGSIGQRTLDTPVVAELNEKAYVLWLPTDGTREICMSSRALDYRFLQSTWMKYAYKADSYNSLMSLVIPGTHDSCAVGGGVAIKTQNLSISEHLNSGIRFFDLRVGFSIITYKVAMYHGIAPLYNNGKEILFDDDVMAAIKAYLDHNNETVVISVKADGIGWEDDIFDGVNSIFLKYTQYIYNGRGFPTLAEPIKWPHGKIVVILRTDSTTCKFGFHLSPSQWPGKDTAYAPIPNTQAGPFFIQDFFDLNYWDYVEARDAKVSVIKEAMVRSNPDSLVDNFICFTSATGWNSSKDALTPEALATGYAGDDGINKTMVNNNWGKKVPGIYPMDFPDNPTDLVSTMIGTNFP